MHKRGDFVARLPAAKSALGNSKHHRESRGDGWVSHTASGGRDKLRKKLTARIEELRALIILTRQYDSRHRAEFDEAIRLAQTATKRQAQSRLDHYDDQVAKVRKAFGATKGTAEYVRLVDHMAN